MRPFRYVRLAVFLLLPLLFSCRQPPPSNTTTGAAKPDELSLATKVDQWAAKTLPDVQAHLKEAEQVYGALGTGE